MAAQIMESNIYDRIIEEYKSCNSVLDTSLKIGISVNTVRRVLITENMWSSKRSREVVALVDKGMNLQEIAEALVLSPQCVQNYMPYVRGMNLINATKNSQKAMQKRERMKIALENQHNKMGISSENIQVKDAVIQKERVEMEKLFADLGEPVKKSDRPRISAKKYIPAVYKLHFELVDYEGNSLTFGADELGVLKKYAKVESGFTRDVLVPSYMSLNALHYMIQKLYGWQNGHLHRFSLPRTLFDSITNRGSISAWEHMCGVLFRFPDEDRMDRNCGDDYDGTQSFKTWIKNKYSGAELPFSIGDTYIFNQRLVDEFESFRQKTVDIKECESIEHMQTRIALEGEPNELLERLSLEDILTVSRIKIDIHKWLSDTYSEIDERNELIREYRLHEKDYVTLMLAMDELRSRRITQAQMEKIMHMGAKFSQVPKTSAEKIYADNKKEIRYYEANCRRILSALEPKITPLTNTMLYHYDYGDGWCVRITCTDGYYINDYFDYPNAQGWITVIAKEKDVIKDWDFYNCANDMKIDNSFADILRLVVSKKVPRCFSSDGIFLLDDVGGIGGFVKMLKVIHGEDEDEAESMRAWAKSQGWFGRAIKPENML